MSTVDILVLMCACIAAFLATSNVISMILGSDMSKGNFMLFQWVLLVVYIIAFLVARGVASL
jgi:hypothetical protein